LWAITLSRAHHDGTARDCRERLAQGLLSEVCAVPRAPAITYQLLIRIERARRVRVGRLGTFTFPAGRYVYTGSARRGLEARVARHLSRAKQLRWHIDYLLAASGVTVESVRRSSRPECATSLAVGGGVPVAGFGASDCHSGCRSHLRFLGP
jgi:Uri superfamily endonuclease